MPLTEAELKLQKKYEELRKKREEQRKQKIEAGPSTSGRDSLPKGGDALQKAKAALAKKSTAAATVKPPANEKPPPTVTSSIDPIVAAKQALEAKNKTRGSSKRPAQKRPVQRVAKPRAAEAGNAEPAANPAMHLTDRDGKRRAPEEGPSSAWEVDQPETKRHRPEAYQEQCQSRGNTIFVGDLPPFYKNADVWGVFATYGPVEDVHVFSDSCYAFVTFQSVDAAQRVLQRFRTKPLTAHGHTLRINQAHGQMSQLKKGPAGHRRDASHPKVAEARSYGNHLAEQLLAAGTHGLDFSAKPQARQLITYDDL